MKRFSLFCLIFCLALPSAYAQDFDSRAQTLIDYFASRTPELPTNPVNQYSKRAFWYAQAKFQTGQTEEARSIVNSALDLISQGQTSETDPWFQYWAAMDTYLRWKSLYTPELIQKTRDKMTSYPYFNTGFTPNHRLMVRTARYLAAQEWPDATFASDALADDPTAVQYLLEEIDNFVHVGAFHELDSDVYMAFHTGPLLSLLDLATDATMVQHARLGFEWFFANAAGEYLNGHWITSSMRIRSPIYPLGSYQNADATHWLYFGGAPFIGNERNNASVVPFAISSYRLPGIMADIANDRDQPHTHLERGRGPDGVRYLKTNYLNQTYGMFSQYEYNGPLRFNKIMLRWGVKWDRPGEESEFWIKHPSAEGNLPNEGGTQFEEVMQHEGTLVGVYDIQSADPYPALRGFTPTNHLAVIDDSDSGRVYLHYETVMIALTLTEPFDWDASDRFLDKPATKLGLVVETAAPDAYGSGGPAAQLAAFKQAIVSQTTLDASGIQTSQPTLRYTSLSGDLLEISYENYRRINGHTLDLDVWPMLHNPRVYQDYDDDILTIRQGNQSRTYDFGSFTVSEGPATLSAPRGLEAQALSDRQVKLRWDAYPDNATAFSVERSANGSPYAVVGEAGGTDTTFIDPGLTADVSYQYRLRATNGAEQSIYATPARVQTQMIAPVAPDSLVAVQSFFDRVALTWQDVADNEAGYRIERQKTGGNFVIVGEVEANATQFTDSTLSNTGKYVYRVYAFNGGGASFAERSVHYNPTIASLNLTSFCSNDPAYERRWRVRNPNNFNVDVTWRLYGTAQQGALVAPPGDSYFFTPGQGGPNTTKLTWYDAQGKKKEKVKASSGAQCNLPVPAAPTALALEARCVSELKLRWTDADANEDVFEIERETAAGTYVQIAEVPANETSFVDSGLREGTAYTYRIRALSRVNGHSSYSQEVTDTTTDALIYLTLNGNTQDESGTNDGVNNGSTFTPFGKFEQAAEFDGADDYVALPAGLLGNERGSVSMWVKTTQTSVGMLFYATANGGNGFGGQNELHIHLQNDGSVALYHQGQDGLRMNGGPIADNNWHHVVATWDVADEIKLYVDGVNTASEPHNGNPFTFTDNMRLGRVSTAERYFKGTMDEVKIYDCPLKPADVKRLFDNGYNPIQASITYPLVGQAQFADDVAFAVAASHDTAAIARVSFFVNGQPIGEVSRPPYRYTWTDAEVGTAQFYAQVTGTDGASLIVGPQEIAVIAAPDGEVYQAETALREEGGVENNNPGYTGTGFVNYNNVVGSYLEWTINVAEDNQYALGFRYANGASQDRKLRIDVDGVIVDTLSFDNTGSFQTWITNYQEVSLTAGTHTVRATSVVSSGGPNVDYLVVVPGGVAPSAPTGLTATVTGQRVSLAWNENPETDLVGYYVYQSVGNDSSFSRLTGALVTESFYQPSADLAPNTIYYYFVTAVDGNGGESASSAVATAAVSTLEDGLVLHWSLDETTGTTAGDASGNNRNGDLLNGFNFDSRATEGIRGGGLTFSSNIDDVIRYEEAQLVDRFPYSVATWINTTSGALRTAVYLGDGSFSTFNIVGISGGKAQILTRRGSSQLPQVGTVTINDGEWHQVTAVFESETSRRLYVDGQLDREFSDTAAFVSDISRFSIGRNDRSSPVQAFAGGIDEVRLYGRALTDGEIAILSNQGSTRAAHTTGTKPAFADEEAVGWQMYPNPTRSSLNIIHPAQTAGAVRVVVHNQAGQVVLEETRQVRPGRNHLTLSTERLSPGLYLLEWQTTTEHRVEKLLVEP